MDSGCWIVQKQMNQSEELASTNPIDRPPGRGKTFPGEMMGGLVECSQQFGRPCPSPPKGGERLKIRIWPAAASTRSGHWLRIVNGIGGMKWSGLRIGIKSRRRVSSDNELRIWQQVWLRVGIRVRLLERREGEWLWPWLFASGRRRWLRLGWLALGRLAFRRWMAAQGHCQNGGQDHDFDE